jgi:5-methylcytosine-specific restriction protein A
MSNKNSASSRGYNRRWGKFRKVFLQEHPLCKFCEQEGKLTAAKVVDHIRPHRGNQSLFWDKDNMQPLCIFHHVSTKQAMENGKEKPIIGDDGWPVDDDT